MKEKNVQEKSSKKKNPIQKIWNIVFWNTGVRRCLIFALTMFLLVESLEQYGMHALAENGNQFSEENSTNVKVEEKSITEEPSGGEPSTGDLSGGEPSTAEEPTREEPTTEELTTEEPTTEEPTTEEPVTEEATEKELQYRASVDGIGITVVGKQLKEGGRLLVSMVEDTVLEQLLRELEQLALTNGVQCIGAKAFDIVLQDASGDALSLNGEKVRVRLVGQAEGLDATRHEVKVYDVRENKGSITLESINGRIDGNDICFDTDHFSIYAYAVYQKGNEPRLMNLAAEQEVDILGQLAWEDTDWKNITRPGAGTADMLKLYAGEGDSFEESNCREIELQTESSTKPNYLSWTITKGEDFWSYTITHVTRKEDEKLYVKVNTTKDSLSSYGSENPIASVSKTTTSGVEMENVRLKPNLQNLTVKKTVVGSGDNTSFTFDIKVGKTVETATTDHPTIKSIDIKAAENKTVAIPVGIAYEITERKNDNYVASYDANKAGIMTAEGITTQVTNLQNNSEISLTKIWNDNNSKSRISKESWSRDYLKLYYSIEEQSGEQELTEDKKADLGIEDAITVNCSEESYNRWKVSYKNGDSFKFPSYTTEGKKITYTVKEDDVEMRKKGYLPFSSGDTLTNTSAETFQGSLFWEDAAQTGKRPHETTLILYRYQSSDVEKPEKLGTVTLSAESASVTPEPSVFDSAYIEGTAENEDREWKFTLTGLPSYSETGEAYTYYVKEEPLTGTADNYYKITYDNKSGVHGSNVTECYNGGDIHNTLTATTTFRAWKEWKDECTSEEERKTRSDGILYLYRYPANKNPAEASPVILLDADKNSIVVKKPVDKTKNSYEITFDAELNDKKLYLQKYNEDGDVYIYFVREILADDTYVKNYDNTNAEIKNITDQDTYGVFHGGTLTNTRQGEMDYTITKNWKTTAMQDGPKDMTVYVKVEGKAKKAADSEWQEVTKAKESAYEAGRGFLMDGFSAEVLSRELCLKLPAYDADGRAMEYRVQETEIIEKLSDGTTKVLSKDTNNIFTTSKGCRYQSKVEDLSDGSGAKIDNTLVGTLDYTIIKRWSPVPSDSASASATVVLFRTDHLGNTEEVSEITLTNADLDNTRQSNFAKAESEERYWSRVIQKLPKYDSEGYEYTYTVEERGHTATHPTGGTYAAYITYGKNQATINNITGGASRQIWVRKVWKDGGDTQYRCPVTVGLFGENSEAVTDNGKPITITLSVNNNWRSCFSLPVDKYPSFEGYTVREISMGDGGSENTVTYKETDITEAEKEMKAKKTCTLEGTGETADHHYKVENTCTYTPEEGDKKDSLSAIITNTRTGTLKVEVTKKWVDGSRDHAHRPTLTLTLQKLDSNLWKDVVKKELKGTEVGKGDAASADPAWKVETNTWTYTFGTDRELPKYDEEGRLISYQVTERMNPSEDYVSQTEETGYTLGEKHTGDVKHISITNTREGFTNYTVYKKWKDLSATTSRPDIYVELYYRIGENGDIKRYEQTEETEDNGIWVGKLEYIWSEATVNTVPYDSFCEVRNLCHYTPDGREVYYFTRETINAENSEYKTAYYEKAEEIDQVITGENSENLLEYAPNEGYIVNRLAGEIIVNGIKIWTNLQEGVELSDFSGSGAKIDVKLDLYRYSGTRPEGEVLGNENFLARKQLESPYNSFKFVAGEGALDKADKEITVPSLDKYDEKGQVYHYEIVESMNDDMKRVYKSGSNIFKLTNTYLTDENNTRAIKIDKTWKGLEKLSEIAGEDIRYPEVVYKLYRIPYSESFDSQGPKELMPYRTMTCTPDGNGTDTYADVTFDDLRVWAENGEQYRYAVEEELLSGYEVQITESGENTNWYVIPEEKYGTIGAVPKDTTVSFTNTFYGTDTKNRMMLTGTKAWVDKNADVLRPKLKNPPEITVYRWAAGSGAGNSMGNRNTELSSGNYTIEWADTDSTDNQWSYTITGDGILNFAPNGKPYQYRVVEKPVSNYKADNGGVAEQSAVRNTVNEDMVSSGNVTYEQSMGLLTNRLKAEHRVTKTWNDNGNRYGLRPEYVVVKLQRKIESEGSEAWTDVPRVAGDGFANMTGGDDIKSDGTTDQNQVVKAVLRYDSMASKSWCYTFANLAPVNGNGEKYQYRAVECAVGVRNRNRNPDGTQSGTYTVVAVKEPDVGGNTTAGAYTVAHTTENKEDGTGSTTITNTQQNTTFTVTKKWADNGNQYNSRPENQAGIPQVEFQLQMRITTEADTDNNYTTLGTYKLSGGADTLAMTFSDLPKCDILGKTYVYRAVEIKDNVQNYEVKEVTTESETIITNTLLNSDEAQLRTVKAKKEWVNATAGNGKPGETVTFQLKRFVQEKSTDSWTELPYYPEKRIELDGSIDADAEDMRETQAWTAQWDKLPKTHTNGATICYKVEEVSKPEGYLTTVTGEDTGAHKEVTFTVTNTAHTSLKVTKQWEDAGNRFETRPDSVMVKLQRAKCLVTEKPAGKLTYEDVTVSQVGYDGIAEKEKLIRSITGNGTQDQWSITYENLPRYGMEENQEYAYYYRAVEVVRKSDSSYEEVGSQNGAYAVALSGETADAGYWKEASQSFEQTITNQLMTGSLKVTKKWEDGNNRDGLRTKTVKLELKHDGNSYGTPYYLLLGEGENGCDTEQQGNHIICTVTGLPIYQANGEKIAYTLEEIKENRPTGENGCGTWERLQDYQTTYSPENVKLTDTGTASSMEVINTYVPKRVTKTVKKIWTGDAAYGGSLTGSTRPDSVTVYLWMTYTNENGERVTASVKPNGMPHVDNSGAPIREEGNLEATPYATKKLSGEEWSASWSDLYAFCNEKHTVFETGSSEKIQYSVTEELLPGYTLRDTQENEDTFTLTNTMKSTELSVEKQWSDSDNTFKTRPNRIQFTLERKHADESAWVTLPDTVTETMTGTSFSQIQFMGLPTHDKTGKEYSYRAVEKEVTDYTPTYSYQVENGKDQVTNTLKTLSISGEKQWAGDQGLSNLRPDSVTLRVYASKDGGKTYEVLAVPPGNIQWKDTTTDTWSYTITGLPKAWKYYVQEEPVPGYQTTYPAYQIGSGVQIGTSGTVGADGNITQANIKNELAKVTIQGEKIWEDTNDQYKMRPAMPTGDTDSREFALELWASTDGNNYEKIPGDSYEISWQRTENTAVWKYEIGPLPRHGSNGVYTNYKVTEGTVPTGYEVIYGTRDSQTTGSVVQLIAGTTSYTAPTMTNTLKMGSIQVTKQLLKPDSGTVQDSMKQDAFIFQITCAAPSAGAGTAVSGVWPFSYQKWTGSSTSSAQDLESANGEFTLKHEESAKIQLPEGWKWCVTEKNAGDMGYAVEDIKAEVTPNGEKSQVTVDKALAQASGTIPEKSASLKITVENKPTTLLKIQNTTKNEADGSTNAGGTVGIIKGGTTENEDEVDYVEGALEAVWSNANYWQQENSFTVISRKYGEKVETLEVKGYRDANGQLITDTGNEVYKELKKAYPDFTIQEEVSGKVRLKFGNNASTMPASVQIQVAFVPTIATINTTQAHAGGLVGINQNTMNEQGDGTQDQSVGSNGRYGEKTTVLAAAKTGYCIDTGRIAIGTPGIFTKNGNASRSLKRNRAATEGYILVQPHVAADGTFTLTAPLPVNSNVLESVPVSGRIAYTYDGSGNPVKAELTLNQLTAPLDVGIPFVTATLKPGGDTPDGSSESSGTSGSSSNQTVVPVSPVKEVPKVSEHAGTSGVVPGEENDRIVLPAGTVLPNGTHLQEGGILLADGTVLLPNGTALLGVVAKTDIEAFKAALWGTTGAGSLIPRTGDGFALWIWMLLAAASLCGVLFLFWMLKKRKRMPHGQELALGVCLVIFLICVFALGQYFWQNNKAASQVKKFQEELAAKAQVLLPETDITSEAEGQNLSEEDAKELLMLKLAQAENPDIVGWISIPGTKIDYPLMHTPAVPGYYLNHGMDRSYSASGMPYLDERCSLESDHLVIYGHHMKDGSMFAGLLSFGEEAYGENHERIRLVTSTGIREYEVTDAFALQADEEDRLFQQTEGMDQGSITLCTCAYGREDGRFAVTGAEIQQ